MLNNLAGGLLERYDLTGLIADVDEAIEVLDEAISSHSRRPPGPPGASEQSRHRAADAAASPARGP